MENNKKKMTLKEFFNTFEIYIGTGLFLALTVLLTIQVISRYVLQYSFAWTEELAEVMFVWMIYCGIAAAVRKRKFLRIEVLLDALPFRYKRILLVIDNIIQAAFSIFIIFPILNIIANFQKSNATSSILHIPKVFAYMVVPISMGLCLVRIAQEIYVLLHEDEKKLGVSKASLDLDEIERQGQIARSEEIRKAGDR